MYDNVLRLIYPTKLQHLHVETLQKLAVHVHQEPVSYITSAWQDKEKSVEGKQSILLRGEKKAVQFKDWRYSGMDAESKWED